MNGGAAVSFTGAPFAGNKSTNLRDMTDGTSSTMLVGEVIIGINGTASAKGPGYGPYDHRGDVFNDDANCAMFMTYTTPNSKIPDQMASLTFCGNLWSNNPPCNALLPVWNAARSRHPGGVNILFADGSVKYIKDSVSANAWRAIGSPAGNEVISSDSF